MPEFESTKTSFSTSPSVTGLLTTLILLLSLAVSGVFGGLLPEKPVALNFPPGSPMPRSIAIEDMTVGLRVIGENPELTDLDRAEFGPEPTRENSKSIGLTIFNEDGSRFDAILVRPNEWFGDEPITYGTQVFLDLPEIGVSDWADITFIGPCPVIAYGTGPIVTGTFRHTDAEVLDLSISCLTTPIGTTAAHPFWSVDRQQFIAVADLYRGETLRTATGLATVTSVTNRPELETVYNLEVSGEHVYHVTEAGVLVHNMCGGATGKHGPISVTPRGVAVTTRTLAKQGSSRLAGNFTGLAGRSVDDIIARVPRTWRMAPQDRGMGVKFLDDMGFERIRIHGPTARAPAGSNSASGWTMRVMDRAGNYYNGVGGLVPYRANSGHIPILGNPYAP